MYDAPDAAEELKQLGEHLTEEKVEAIKEVLKYFEAFWSILKHFGVIIQDEEKEEGLKWTIDTLNKKRHPLI